MRRLWAVVAVLALSVGLLGVGAPTGAPGAQAHAGGDECVALGGTINGGGECEVSTFEARTSTAHGGSFDIDETLRITGSGRIDATGGGITINVDGDLILETPTAATGGQIEANDPSSPTGSSASPITLAITGNMEMQPGTVIEARNATGAGSGAAISITVDGNLAMAGTSGADPGARIDNGAGGASGNSAGASLTLNVGGDMEMGSGSAIKGESVQNGHGTAIGITVGGNLTLHGAPPSGALISSSVVGGTGGNAGSININVGDCVAEPPTGDFLAEPGSVIKANSTKGAGGAIVVNACRDSSVDALVESASGRSGTGAVQGPGGGTISLDAGCDLTITDDGRISSRGQNPGADLVRLEGGCSVLVLGLVESTGVGHAVPNSPKNHCNNAFRPDKPANSTTCVEIWAGDDLTIDSDAAEGHNGEINADHFGQCGARGWIDLFARGEVIIDGDATGPFAVHANANCATNQAGGLVAVASIEGSVTGSGLALSADANVAGGRGGQITVEAAQDIDLDTASVFARGDFNQTGGYGFGGDVRLRSFNGTIAWPNGVGDVRPTGTDNVGTTLPASNRGEIVFQDCTVGAVDVSGTSFPDNGAPATTPSELSEACGGAPEPPGYVALPDCACAVAPPCKWCTKGAVLSQVVQNLGVCCAVPDILVDVRGDKNDPILPEELGSNQPATGSIQAAIDYVNSPAWLLNDPTPNDGEIFIGITAQDCDTGVVGEGGDCAGQTGRGPNGDGSENVVITNTRSDRLNVFACSIDIYAADRTKPVVTIEDSIGKVTVLDVHVHGSLVGGYVVDNNADLVVVKNSRSIAAADAGANSIGYWITDDDVEITGSPETSGWGIGMLVAGSEVTLRTNNDINDNGVGIKITGDNNESNGNDVGDDGVPNGTGILVEGKDNLLHGDNVIYNTGDGIVVTGSGTSLADGNFVTDEDSQHNGDDGIVVTGSFNTLDGNRQVKFNAGDGIEIGGNSNLLDGNTTDENDGHGINVSGNANTLDQNESNENDLDGIHVSGDNNVLVENTAEDNGGNGIKADTADGASGNTLEDNEGDNNALQGIRACAQIDSGGNTGSGNGVNPQVDFVCAVAGPPVFFVADGNGTVYKYDAAGVPAGTFDLDSANGNPAGVAVVGDDVYVLDSSDDRVYRYDAATGALEATSRDLEQSNTAGADLGTPTGLAIEGDSLWIVDDSGNELLRFDLSDAFAGGGSLNALEDIALSISGNADPRGLAIDADCLYVLDNDDLFYRYDRTDVGSACASATSNGVRDTGGSTIGSLAGAVIVGTSMWVVEDGGDMKAYEYALASLFPGGSTLSASSDFDLDPANDDAKGI
jgi:hypothetical protein